MHRGIKRISIIAAVAVLALLSLTACGKSEFGLTENTDKRMTVTAEHAAKDAFFMVGSLEVADGEQVVITSGLTKGMVRVELVRASEEQSIEELPDMDGEAEATADVSAAETVSETVPAGRYMLRGTCLKKATGTVQIEVRPAS